MRRGARDQIRSIVAEDIFRASAALTLQHMFQENIWHSRRCIMALTNKLGIDDPAELAREEERISKKKAVALFENGIFFPTVP